MKRKLSKSNVPRISLLAIMSCFLNCNLAGGEMIKMEQEAYAWGPYCANGTLSVGLRVAGRTFDRLSAVSWSWALRNLTTQPRLVTIQYNLDLSFRYRLQIFRVGSSEVVEEFTPSSDGFATTDNRARTILVAGGEIVEQEPEEAAIGARLGPGRYVLKLQFGGPDFTFQCESGAIEIEVRG